MVEKNEFYRDFSNRVSFNGAACRADEVLAPVVVDDYKDYLRTLGLKWDNVETWHFPYSNEGVPVAFIPVKQDEFDGAMKAIPDSFLRIKLDFRWWQCIGNTASIAW